MTRSVPYRHQISEIVNWNQIKAVNDTLFILREIGPVGFIIQEEGCEKKHKVCLGDPHSCTCKDFRKEKDLCKHICWILLKKYKLDRNDPISWQLGLVQREINDLIFSKQKTNKPAAVTSPGSNEESDNKAIVQRHIDAEDVCPICQDDLKNVHKPVTFCRHGCGNSVHIRCMSVWADHKKKELNLKMQDPIPCPMCRGEFGTLQILLMEMTNSKEGKVMKKKASVSMKQISLSCCNCKVSPITGRAHKCTSCSYYFLCDTCFNGNVHAIHSFCTRDDSSGKWSEASSSRGLSVPTSGLVDEVIEVAQIQKTERQNEGSNLRQPDINRFSSWTVSSKSNLSQPGHQCRICLMSYKDGDIVRKLPRCQHVFHTLCIDQWLLHRSQRCPIDDIDVLRVLPPSQSQKSLMTLSANQYTEDRQGIFRRHSKDLTSSLLIAPINSRQSSSSDESKVSRGYFAGMPRSAINKSNILPPIQRHGPEFNDALSITPLKLNLNATK